MKRKVTKKEWSSTWLTTVTSIIALLFAVLVGFGVISPEQSAEAQPIISTTLGAISTIIASVMAIIGIFFKNDEV